MVGLNMMLQVMQQTGPVGTDWTLVRFLLCMGSEVPLKTLSSVASCKYFTADAADDGSWWQFVGLHLQQAT